jgi:hypothetical protein
MCFVTNHTRLSYCFSYAALTGEIGHFVDSFGWSDKVRWVVTVSSILLPVVFNLMDI